ncbi:heat shock 70 kDa protein, mitochondrial, partial [Tanacetum coccineum]
MKKKTMNNHGKDGIRSKDPMLAFYITSTSIVYLIISALLYGLNTKERLIVVFHLGYVTFNVSILEISNGVFEGIINELIVSALSYELNSKERLIVLSSWLCEHGNSHKNAQKYHFSTHADIKYGNIIPYQLEVDLV